MKKNNNRLSLSHAVGLFALCALTAQDSFASTQVNGANTSGTSISIWACIAMATMVFVAIVYSLASFRRSDETSPSTTEGKRLQELVWALVPIGIVIAAAAPAVRDSSANSVGAEAGAIHGVIARVDYALPAESVRE